MDRGLQSRSGKGKTSQQQEGASKAEKHNKKSKAQNVLTESQQNEIKKAFDYFDITGSGKTRSFGNPLMEFCRHY